MTHSRRHRRVEGAAAVEAVIMLPVFAVLLVGVFHLARIYTAAGDAREQARRCAWLYAQQGCEGDAPVGCEQVPLRVELRHDETSGRTASPLRNAAESEPADEGLTGSISVLQSAIGSLVGTAVRAPAARELPLPPLLAEHTEDDDERRDNREPTVTVNASFTILCNPTQPTPLEDVKRIIGGWI